MFFFMSFIKTRVRANTSSKLLSVEDNIDLILVCIVSSSGLLQTEGQLEVTYNAAGIICHLAFDGPDNWTNHIVSRDQALDRLVCCCY